MSRGRRRQRRERYAALPQRTAGTAALADPDPVATQPLPPELAYPRLVTEQELTGGKTDAALTAELAEQLRKIPACTHCGGRHTRACPRVKRMSFHPNGSLASVEFWPGSKWDDSGVIWPEQLEDAE